MSITLIIMAKAPIAGYAKTRLIPALGAEAAAQLAQRMLRHTVQEALASQADQVIVYIAPHHQHPAVEALGLDQLTVPTLPAEAPSSTPPRLTLRDQGEGDLGQRMLRAFVQTLPATAPPESASGATKPTHGSLIIGTDAPDLDRHRINQAIEALSTTPAVLIPAHDGGYALIALTRPIPELLLDMTWSTPEVMAQTRARAQAIGLRWTELAPVADIDEPADLAHLPEGWR